MKSHAKNIYLYSRDIFFYLKEKVFMQNTLIIALDKLSKDEAKSIIDRVIEENPEFLDRIVFKVNDLLALIGFEWIKELFTHPKAFIMLDPKYYDIGNTLCNYLEQIKNSELWEKVKLLTVHSSNGEKALKKLSEKKKQLWLDNLKILGITLLTSLDWTDSAQVYGKNPKDTVLNLASIAYKAWLDWVVCSPLETKILRENYGENFLLVTPWVRFEWEDVQDQIRIATPAKTITNWSSAIVMWRSILWSENMSETITKFFDEIDSISPLIASTELSLSKLISGWNWEKIMKYIGVFYMRKQWWKYCRLASGIISNWYINIGILERYPNILQKIWFELRQKLVEKNLLDENNLDDYIVIGAQMWSVRISSHLSLALWINGTSIYVEKDGDRRDKLALKRHNIDLKWKKIIISEDIISAWSTLKRMIKLIENLWGNIVAVTCFGNRYWKEEIEGIPLLYCYKPEVFELSYDEKTPEEFRWNLPHIEKDAKISERAKYDWDELVMSMR